MTKTLVCQILLFSAFKQVEDQSTVHRRQLLVPGEQSQECQIFIVSATVSTQKHSWM